MLQRLLVLAALCVACLQNGQALAVCPPHRLAKAAEVRLTGPDLMIVTHATSTHDARFSAKRGVDEAVRFAKSRDIPVIYLEDDTPGKFYYLEDCEPDYWVFSQGGEISLDLAAVRHLYIVGGHLELCLSTTLHDVIYQWAKQAPHNLTITYFMDAIYSNGKLIDPTDPFYNDFQRFMGIVAYGRPGGEHWPKLNLLESMGVILREEHQLEYLKQALPRWDTTFPPAYRIELQLNDSVKKVLRAADGWNPPTVLFRFVDSALNLAVPILQ